MLAVTDVLVVEPISRYHWLNEIQDRKDKVVHITLNENPMYFDEEGNRNYEEPAYQTVIRVNEREDNRSEACIYDYFDTRTPEEAILFIHEIQSEITSLGFPKVLYI